MQLTNNVIQYVPTIAASLLMNCAEIEKCRNIDLVDDLLKTSENAIVEFKKNNIDPQKIGMIIKHQSHAN